MYTVTYSKMERVAIALLTANVDKECEFTRYLKHLLAQPNVEKYMKGAKVPGRQVSHRPSAMRPSSRMAQLFVDCFWTSTQHLQHSSHR